MKRFYTLILCAMAFIAMVSCKKDDKGGADEPSMIDVSWTASFESFSTKASLGDNLSVDWKGNEAISVFSNKKNYRFDMESSEGQDAVFSGTIESAKTYYALYPYDETATSSSDNITATLPASQTLIPGNFDPAAIIAAARTSGDEILFKNMVALLAIRYSGDVKSISVSGASDSDRIAGKVRINTGTDKATVVTGSSRISLEGVPQSGSTYYVAVIPGTVSGLIVTAVNEDGLSADMTISSGSITLERNTVYEYAVDFSDAGWILRPPTGQSYEINGADELAEFCAFLPNPKEEVVDLTISGSDITDEMLAKVQDRVGAVLGDIEWNNVGATTTAGFFDVIDCRKGISFIDCRLLEFASGLDSYTSICGDFTVRNCPALVWGFNAIEAVAGSFNIENTDFTSFSGAALTTIGGDINITGNESLTSLDGLDRLTSIGGNVIILDNGDIPTVSNDESVGFCIIREYINKNIISSTANIRLGTSASSIDLSELPSCDGTMPGEPQSYVLNGKAEIEAFVNAGITDETVNNLTISGDDFDSGTLHSVAQRVYTIKGTLTLENIGYVGADSWGCGTENFLEFFTHNNIFEGSIVLRNIAGEALNPNGFVNMTEVKGSIVVENCPGFCLHWGEGNGFANIKKIGGDMKVINSGIDSWFDGGAWGSIEYIGGSFVLEGLQHLYFLRGIGNLTYLGGDLVIKDCYSFWGLNGLENLTYLGGNVVLSNYGKLQIKNGEVDGEECIGMCLLRDFIDNRVMNSDATVTIIKDDTEIDFSTVKSCSATYEGDKNGGNEKYPDPDPITGWN